MSNDLLARIKAEIASQLDDGEWSAESGAHCRALDLLEEALEALERSHKAPCAWDEDEDGVWNTACGNAFVFTDGGPKENQLAFCPYCGHKLWPSYWDEGRSNE